MNPRIGLAGHKSRWRFEGSHALEARLELRPWIVDGAVILVRCERGFTAEHIAHEIERTVYGADAGMSDVRVIRINGEEHAGKLETALQIALGVNSIVPDRLSGKLVECPRVLILEPPESEYEYGFVVAAEKLVEALTKRMIIQQRLVIIVLDASEQMLRSQDYDFSHGEPVDAIRYAIQGSWPAYLHARIAWEAGTPAQADSLNSIALRFPEGEDEQLEQALNQYADQRFSRLSPAELVIEQGLRASLLDPNTPSSQRIHSEGVQAKLLFRRAGALLPMPWLARYWLRNNHEFRSHALARGALSCAPLAETLLAGCLSVEVRRRGILESPDLNWGEDADRQFQRLQTMGDPCYPLNCPAKPSDAVAFMSFGELLKAARDAQKAITSADEELRRLRNQLAHGHYVTWQSITRYRNINAQLS